LAEAIDFEGRKNVTLQLRAPNPNDWDAILRCANASLPWHPESNDEWLQNRMRFDAAKYQRRHYVVENSAAAEVVGYGTLEGGPRRIVIEYSL
jgi:hypothetical protein